MDGSILAGFTPLEVIVNRMIVLLYAIWVYLLGGKLQKENATDAMDQAPQLLGEAGYPNSAILGIHKEAQGVITAMDKFLEEI